MEGKKPPQNKDNAKKIKTMYTAIDNSHSKHTSASHHENQFVHS